MNILPKKRWHVRTKDNIARVRRDEAEALEKEKEIQNRGKLAEQEARIDVLRQKARTRYSENTVVTDELNKGQSADKEVADKEVADIYTNRGNINFFKDIEAGLQGGSSIKNEEDRKEKEAYEKKIGLLTQLGQDSMELSGGKYWYEEKSHFIFHNIEGANDKEVGLKQKMMIDPLNEILKYTSSSVDMPISKRKLHIEKELASLNTTKMQKKKSKHKKRAKSAKYLKKKIKKKSKKYSSSDGEEELLKIDMMKKLRKERLERETKEKLRAERLLAGKDPDGNDIQFSKEDSHQKYNSQFNPIYARQNR